MGILDDAIRQHLELKRQHGADDNDLERLEQEAFGPATRPGDPEFDTGAEAAVGSEAATTVAPSLPDAGPPSSRPEPEPPHASEPEPEPAPEELPSEASPAEQARIEHPHLDDTVDHPAIEPPPEPEAEPGPEPVEAPEGSIFFDQDASEEAAAAAEPPAGDPVAPVEEEGIEEVAIEDFEIDLDQPAPPAEGEAEVTQVPFEPAPAEPADPATDFAEGGEGGDDDFELEVDLDDEPFDESQPPAPSAAPEPATEIEFELDEELEDQIEDEDEDLLEETPDFLQDAPEGERLWFEQGEPKDFDFDD